MKSFCPSLLVRTHQGHKNLSAFTNKLTDAREMKTAALDNENVVSWLPSNGVLASRLEKREEGQ